MGGGRCPPLLHGAGDRVRDDSVHKRDDHGDIPRACARNRACPPDLRHTEDDEAQGREEGEQGGVAPCEIGVPWLVPCVLRMVRRPVTPPKDEVLGENDGHEWCYPVADETLITGARQNGGVSVRVPLIWVWIGSLCLLKRMAEGRGGGGWCDGRGQTH